MSATNESSNVSMKDAYGNKITVDDLVTLYRSYAKVPLPIDGQLYVQNNHYGLRLAWKINDMDKLEAIKFVKQYFIELNKNNNEIDHVYQIGDPIDVSDELGNTTTAKGSKYCAVIRKETESGKTKQWLEIWDKKTKLRAIEVDTLEEHGNILVNTLFSSLIWSPDGKQLLYTAEYKLPKQQSFYKKKNGDKNGDNSQSKTAYGQEFVYQEDWGETLDGIVHPIICILNVENYKIRTIEMKEYSLGQPFWIGDGQKVGFVGWPENPRRLGLVFCPIRENALYYFDLNNESNIPELLYKNENHSVRLPRVNSSGTDLIFLENQSGGPHFKESRLIHLNLANNNVSVIIDTNVSRPILNGNTYGDPVTFYIPDSLPQNCFTSSNKHVILHCYTELKQCLVAVSLEEKTIRVLNFPVDSASILDFNGEVLVAVGSTINLKPNVYIGKFNEKDLSYINWIKVEDSELISEVTFQYFSIPSDDQTKLITAILVSPKQLEDQPSPAIITPHGGPNAGYALSFMVYPIMFANLGFKTLLVNYRGSFGVDKEYLHSLCGFVGDMDVKDVVKCIMHCSDKNQIDKSKLVLFGGSHGGFLVTHLSGQYADMNFKACICRNPVIDMSGMIETTDIPDWCYAFAFGESLPYECDKLANAEQTKTLLEKSPIHWIDKVKVPTLMFLGKEDKRVPYTQGLKYYKTLKARGIDTKCYFYPDKHSLAKANVDGDCFIHLSCWIFNNLHK